jgi:four helix bundle protein
MKNFITYELAKQFYKDCQKLKLKAPLKDQFDRAILSVILNLAEGSAKPTQKDRRRFYSIAMGSLREIQAILDLCGHQQQLQQSDSVAACLFQLIQRPGGSP